MNDKIMDEKSKAYWSATLGLLTKIMLVWTFGSPSREQSTSTSR